MASRRADSLGEKAADAFSIGVASRSQSSGSGERVGTVGEPDQNLTPELKRDFKPRHIQMIAMASNIGTGLFIATGDALYKGGPGSLMIAYIFLTLALTSMMQALCEMNIVLPIPGSFTRYSSRFIDPSIGFASAWLYWMCWIGAFGVESVAASICVHYWTQAIPTPAVIAIFVAVNVLIHILPVSVFGEVEFVVSTLKVLIVFAVICMCWAIMAGGTPIDAGSGVKYWQGDNGPFKNGFKGLASVFVLAAFSCGGTEITGVVSGEASRPRFTLPRGIKTFVFRMCLFYLMALLFTTFVVSSNDTALGQKHGGAGSAPWVIAANNGGVPVIPHIINAVILIAVTSVASCSVYISSRVMHSMGEDGFAPKFLTRTDKQGRPTWALAISGIIAIVIAFISCAAGGKVLFNWLTALSGLTFFLIWGGIVWSHTRFRWAMIEQHDGTLDGEYYSKSKWFPWNNYFAMGAFMFMLACQVYVAISPLEGEETAEVFFQAALPLPVFFAFIVGWKIKEMVHNRSWRVQLLVPLHMIDLHTGRLPEDKEEEKFIDQYRALPWHQRLKSYIPFLTDIV